MVAMMIIGVDPHKSTHTATAVDPQTNRTVASIRIEASLADYRRLLTWAGQFDRATVGNRERRRPGTASVVVAAGSR